MSLFPSKKSISIKWIFKPKLQLDGILQKKKIRLIAYGFKKIYGIDYKENLTLVVK